jgi:DNA-binding response OmpR family regulator
MTPDSPCVLLVEDDPITRSILCRLLEKHDIHVIESETGEEAWDIIVRQGESLDAILLDRILPDMDSLSLLPRLKGLTDGGEHIPVIMQTMMASSADISAGLAAGAYYYLTKPAVPETLLTIVNAAIRDRQQQRALRQALQHTQDIFHTLRHGEFAFRTLQEARDLAMLAAHASTNPERTVLGLSELLYNAVEHGNLGISYAEKTVLIANHAFQQEITRRLARPEYAGREAVLTIERHADETRYTIRDQGKGFDWRHYLAISPERAFDTHGRGIALAAMLSFDAIEYRGCGNEVLGICRDHACDDPAATDTTAATTTD